MTELVRSQSEIFLVMTSCGLACGLVQSLFRKFSELHSRSILAYTLLELLSWAVIGFMVSEFFYFCDNGKLTFWGTLCFLLGLLLWKKVFYGILTPIGGRDGKEKGTNKHI